MNPGYTQGTEVTFDELVTGGPVKTREVDLVENQGQGALTRGAVLGFDSGSGNYARTHQTGNHGAATARAILLKDADPSGGTVKALVLEGGDVNEDELNLGGTVTLDDVREPLRALGIHLKTPVSR